MFKKSTLPSGSSSVSEDCLTPGLGTSRRPVFKKVVQPSPGFFSTKDDFSASHRLTSAIWTRRYDPFQLFQVTHKPCHVVQVHVVEGKDITRGWFRDLLYGPDPYLLLRSPGTPNGCKRTRTINGCPNPVWDEKFTFLFDPDRPGFLEVVLMDANYMLDRVMGRVTINLSNLVMNDERLREVVFENGSKAIIKLLRTEDAGVDLRFGLSLSDEEKAFLLARRVHVLKYLTLFLGKKAAPRTEREVPCIAILGSGGGFRAMSGFSGAMKGLHECGLLDCSMFIASLSGTCWYMSYLYTQPSFPREGPAAFQNKLRQQVSEGWRHLLGPTGLFRYVSAVLRKSRAGQPVSFTDFFGHLVGDILLGDTKNMKLSDQRKVIENGRAPLPLYACLNVKKNVSARVYQDWVEFSPFECGLAKYGTFMRTELFGSKFFMGKMIRKFEEAALHYLLGLWGSAFCILFKRLLHEHSDGVASEYDEKAAQEILENYVSAGEELPEANNDTGSSDEEVHSHSSEAATDNEVDDSFLAQAGSSKMSKRDLEVRQSLWKKRSQMIRLDKEQKQKSFWRRALESLCSSPILDNRTGRAGLVYNPLRGLDLHNTFPVTPFNPTTSSDTVTDFLGLYEPVEVDAKRLFLVDAGLSFNLPFPLLLRPQRAVDVYLAFDFSGRTSDLESPFRDLLLAERWARLNHVSFPPIQQLCSHFLREPQRECYVFQDDEDPCCPVVIFFPLNNVRFRKFKAPGVRRRSKEDQEFGDFAIFNDPNSCYSLFNFHYTPLQFDRLAGLMEFNVLDSLGVIRSELAEAVARKRRLLPKPATTLKNLTLLHAVESMADLAKHVTALSGSSNIPKGSDDSEDEEELADVYYDGWE